MKIAKSIKITAAAILPVVVVLGALFIMSPPGAGKKLASARGIPHRMVAAHRGIAYLAPENTAISFSLAAEIGADYIETDVQLSKDGRLFCFHDKTPERTTDAARVFPGREKDPIGSFTWEELRRLDAGSWFNKAHPDRARPSYAGIKIPSFEEYMDAAENGKNRPGLLIETKSPGLYPGLEKKTVEALARKNWISGNGKETRDAAGKVRVIFHSFDRDSIARLKELAPAVPRSYLVESDNPDTETDWKGKSWTDFVKDAAAMDAQIGPEGTLALPWYTGPAHRKGRLVIPWTLDENWQFRLLTLSGIDGIITNRCDRALEFCGRPFVSPKDAFRKLKI